MKVRIELTRFLSPFHCSRRWLRWHFLLLLFRTGDCCGMIRSGPDHVLGFRGISDLFVERICCCLETHAQLGFSHAMTDFGCCHSSVLHESWESWRFDESNRLFSILLLQVTRKGNLYGKITSKGSCTYQLIVGRV
jgi:hypothetical protein